MNYRKEILEKIVIIDEVLTELNALLLFDHPDVSLDDMSFDSWLKMDFNNTTGKQISMSLIFSSMDLYLFGKDGRRINHFKYQYGFSLAFKKEQRLYSPVYQEAGNTQVLGSTCKCDTI